MPRRVQDDECLRQTPSRFDFPTFRVAFVEATASGTPKHTIARRIAVYWWQP